MPVNSSSPISDEAWGSDVPISMPAPPKRRVMHHLDGLGFAFTEFGICHDFTEADRDAVLHPHYGPTDV